MSDGKVMEFLGKLEAKDKSLGAKVRKFFQNVVDLIKQTINAYSGVSPDSTEGQLIMQMEGVLEELQPVFAEGLYEAGNEAKTNNRVAQDKEIAYSKRGYQKTFFRENVFPPYNESHSDAHEWAERWARSEDAEICNRRLASYHNTWYLIEAFDDMKYGYQIIKKLTAKEYAREAKYYGTIAGYKSIQDTSSKNAALLRGRDANGDAGYRADYDASEHRGKNFAIHGVGTDQNGRKPVEGNSGGNQGGGSSDTHGKNGPAVSINFTKDSARKRVTDREVMRIAEQDGLTDGLNKGQISTLQVFNRKVAELSEYKDQLAEQKRS